MTSQDIISLTSRIKNTWNTNDPYKIAEKFGIVVLHRDNCYKDFTAQTVKFPGYPTIISINNVYSAFSKKLLCAHELGHALLHEGYVNHFAITDQNVVTNVEQEANLFAISLMTESDVDESLCMPLATMNNYLLKAIIDHNLQVDKNT